MREHAIGTSIYENQEDLSLATTTTENTERLIPHKISSELFN